MDRLLINGEWFDAVAGASLYERDFEDVLLSNASTLYPDFVAVRFKALVQSEHGPAKADLALIDHAYREWWVVEVELGTHPLRAHVERQVASLATATYGEAEAEHLASESASLSVGALTEMMRGRQPRVFVIVNEPKPSWIQPLARWSAILGVVEIFRSRTGVATVLRVDGDEPSPVGDIVTQCRIDPLMPRLLRVDSPAGLGFDQHGRGEIWFDGKLTEWRRIDSASAVWIVPLRRYPLPARARTFVLRRSDDNQLSLEVREL